VVQPLVLSQRRTGQKSFYIASHASHILDMDEAPARAASGDGVPRAPPLQIAGAGAAQRNRQRVGVLAEYVWVEPVSGTAIDIPQQERTATKP
jgi:hypothetical protein